MSSIAVPAAPGVAPRLHGPRPGAGPDRDVPGQVAGDPRLGERGSQGGGQQPEAGGGAEALGSDQHVEEQALKERVVQGGEQ